MPPKAKKSSSATKGDEAEELILDYLKKVNRPYSASDISSNLHNQVTKANAQKILISLTEENRIRGKQYGKQWVFCTNQDEIEVPSVEEAEEIDERIKELSQEVTSVKANNSALQSKINSLNNSLTDEQIIERIEELKKLNSENSSRLDELRSGDVVSVDEKKKIEKAYEEAVKLWKQRKRMFREAFDTISENFPGEPKDLLAEIGVETDEDAGLNINALGFKAS
ncbi:hypothetical protein H4219_000802 [Mycoemilia scoparia]|uniref:Homologous-pairing protein 2 homolog n=1 Tax=Mycoemilia scoparia TaxID=417184 RepID=A0A9W8A896_9FUNG|nr:hypothetical protein H4219_000802 [Mycoemilia scoparia]